MKGKNEKGGERRESKKKEKNSKAEKNLLNTSNSNEFKTKRETW